MTYLKKLDEADLVLSPGDAAPDGGWTGLMRSWLGGPVERLSSDDVTALTELKRRRAAVSAWREKL